MINNTVYYQYCDNIRRYAFDDYYESKWCSNIYRKISNIRRTKSKISNASRIGLQLSLCTILKPGVKFQWRMKM